MAFQGVQREVIETQDVQDGENKEEIPVADPA